MQARYYDPVIGRFYSNDPVGFTGDVTSFNRYSYVGNNPYKYTDPDGRNRILALAGKHAAKKYRQVKRGAKRFLRDNGIIAPAPNSNIQFNEDGVPSGDNPPGSREEPIDLEEQLTLEEAKGGAGEKYKGKLGDPKYDPETGTKDKMTHNHDHGDGTSTEVHYDVDRATGEGEGHKIKDDTNAKSRNRREDQ